MSSIEWTDQTWNPTLGCTRVSPGCEHCYAEGVAHRAMQPAHRGLTVLGKNGPRWNGTVNLHPERLAKPLSWKSPRRVFVNSMSDLFHEKIPFEYVAAVFGVMAACEHHTFQVLTKRPERALEFFAWLDEARKWIGEHNDAPHQYTAPDYCNGEACRLGAEACGDDLNPLLQRAMEIKERPWPLSNVWLGTSVEDQERAGERIPKLMECPAAVRFLSCEPLLERVHLALDDIRHRDAEGRMLDWVICGGESGPRARGFDIEWARSALLECRLAGVPFFLKQLGAVPLDGQGHVVARELHLVDRKGGKMGEWPEDLRVRQYPEVSP